MYRFNAELWLYHGDAAWHFVTVPYDVCDDIDARMVGRHRGFGSVRVEVTVGATTWRTSVFPDSKLEAYVLPVKKGVRRREGVNAGDQLVVALEVVEE